MQLGLVQQGGEKKTEEKKKGKEELYLRPVSNSPSSSTNNVTN
ncbi:uncharacterized protein ARB_02324 [Trichophyton benhamiae CBS 112371]|uniref:Uncharacterized protein n=1 Tax=Arthroderma benhamiae (strain ATCC MYA-4681 / CBS 112371) TaxID=663331 RepID=D4B1J5_ARTBC|nr:uncharacterized protein ARB_02324 [Trichophyton benhamiae CBS 112371]EFE30834.1 hypothetical protein ARB_02324 [Trichophyton benhamiae CBS 112371]